MPPARRATIPACMALLLSAAAPEAPPSEVQQVPPEEAVAVLGHVVDGPDGKDIGRLVDILVGPEGLPQAAVIDFGGFMGVGSRKIAVRWSALHFAPGDPRHPVTVELTPDQIKGAPEYKDVAKPAPVVVAAPAPAIAPAQPAATVEPAAAAPPDATAPPAATTQPDTTAPPAATAQPDTAAPPDSPGAEATSPKQ
jgi:PRC-barrel domain